MKCFNNPDQAKPGLWFDSALTTHVPSWALIEDIQYLKKAVEEEDWQSVCTTIECLEDVLDQHTYSPDVQISSSSVVLGGVKPGVVMLADGKDLPCERGIPIGNALACGCIQCSFCDRYPTCFDEETKQPINGLVKPKDCSSVRFDPETYARKIFDRYGEDVSERPFGPCELVCLLGSPNDDSSVFARFMLFDRYSIKVCGSTANAASTAKPWHQIAIRTVSKDKPFIGIAVKDGEDSITPSDVTLNRISLSNVRSSKQLEAIYYETKVAEQACEIIKDVFITRWDETIRRLAELLHKDSSRQTQ